MLASLRKIDRKERESALAALALDLAPKAPETEPQLDDERRDLLLKDVRDELRITDHSAKYYQLINRKLFEELTRSILDKSKIKDVRARVGQNGFLSLSQYEIVFDHDFRVLNTQLGITPGMARDTILHADGVDHVRPEAEGQATGIPISLFAKVETAKTDPYSILVLATREGATLHVYDGFLIFHSDIRPCNFSRPRDLLESFVDKYGVEFEIAGEKSRFIFYKSFPLDRGERDYFRCAGGDFVCDARFTRRRTQTQEEFAVAFVLNISAYTDDLRKHGIKVRSNPEGLVRKPVGSP